MLSHLCVRHGERQERMVCAHVSAAGAARGAAPGRLRQAPRHGDPQVLPAGVVLARALPHAAQFVHRHGGDDRGSDVRGEGVPGGDGISAS